MFLRWSADFRKHRSNTIWLEGGADAVGGPGGDSFDTNKTENVGRFCRHFSFSFILTAKMVYYEQSVNV